MNSYSYRADLMKIDEVEREYVDSNIDSSIIKKLCSNRPTLLEGSRGTGKTMLLKKAQSELMKNFDVDKNLPIYISFNKTLLVKREYFISWMLSKLIYGVRISLMENLNIFNDDSINLIEDLFGGVSKSSKVGDKIAKIDSYIKILEKSAYNDSESIKYAIDDLGTDFKETSFISQVEVFKEFISVLCRECKISRMFFLIDEACHNFLSNEQRDFFSLFRDLTCDSIVCNAAVYPGITSYGESFQKSHDADLVPLNRKITDPFYKDFMREMIKRKIPSKEYKKLENQGELFDALIYSSSGNPRILLKSLSQVTTDFTVRLKVSELNSFIKDFYLDDIWNEHSELLDKYTGHSEIINWGREFIENFILIGIEKRNESKIEKGNFFAIDKENSKTIEHAVKILEYSGIVTKEKENLKKRQNGKNRLWTRYQLNLGIIAARSKNPIDECRNFVTNISSEVCFWTTKTPKIEFDIDMIKEHEEEERGFLKNILSHSVDKLDMSDFLKRKTKEVNCFTIGDILSKDSCYFKKAYYVGDYRSDKIYDEAMSAILEYISG